MIRKIILVVSCMLALTVATREGHAQFFLPGTDVAVCTTIGSDGAPAPCTSLFDQILQYIRQALQLEQEIITATEETTNTLPLAAALFHDATDDLHAVTDLTTLASLINTGTGNFIENLAAPEYPLPPDTGQDQLVREQNAVSNAIEQLGHVIDHENPLIADASAIFDALQAEALLNPGRHMTQQDITQVNAAHAQWTQSNGVVQMATAQAQHAALLAQHDRMAMSNEWTHLMATAYLPIDTGAAPGY